ncbi:MAG: Cna B-type domain-containing protein [Bacilli bacterium]|nr:Cna B-type domain-containing protein [Bacilli bacterium]
MKKFFKYLFILTIMFILPNFVLADETDTTFDHIDINKSVSLKYTVSGNDKIYTKTLDSLADVKLYIVDKDNSNVRTPIDLSGATATDGTYRINGNFNKLYEGTDTFVKYLVEYTFNDQDIYTNLNSNTNKSITYSKEYSFNSEHNKSTDGGILIDLQETNSIQNIPTMLTIKKELENNNTPPGTFTFNIKNASGTIIKTVNITIPEGSTSKEIYFESININTTYLVEEVPDSQNIYKLLSIESTKGDPTIAHDSNATTVRATSTEDVITVTAKNGSAVDHNKEATPNGDGTYQLSLDVTGQNIKDPANKANVVVIFDTSGSMKANSSSPSKTITRYLPTNSTGSNTRYYGLVNGQYVRIYRRGSGSNVYFTLTNSDNGERYTGQRYYQDSETETRLVAGQEAIKSIARALLNNNTTDNPDIVKMALVTFSTTATTNVAPTTTYSTIETAVNATVADGGTNWEDALQKAMAINFGANREATTYYIFVSDGDPTFRVTSHDGWRLYNNGTRREWTSNPDEYYTTQTDGTTAWREGRSSAAGTGHRGSGSTDYYNWNYSDAAILAKAIVDGEADEEGNIVREPAILYSIGAYGDVSRMQSLTNYAYTGSDSTAPQDTYYYSAASTDQLNQALNEILAAIERSGIGAVTISDGTTQSITTSAGVSHLLTVDKSSYEYWLTFNLSDDNKIMVNDTEVTVTKNGDNYTLSWTEGETSKSITAPAGSSIKGNTFVYKWTGANDFYNVAPPQAKLESGSVNWELSKEKVGLLLNDVKYTVTFNVWPSQTTYDLISDFDNGIEDYNDPKYKEIREYLILNDDGSYSLRTNTTAKLTYDDSRDQVGSRDTYFVNPEPVATGVSEVTIEKKWENDLDSREADEIELYLTVDGEDYGEKDEFGNPLPYVLKRTDNPLTSWKKDIFISTGLISLDRTTGTAIVREVGHEYGFREKPSDAYYWDLEVAIRRPMVINKANGELETVMLIKLTDEEIQKDGIVVDATKKYLVKDGIEYFRICYRDENGNDIPDSCHIYRRATTNESNTISAKNYRRSNLNVTKAVDGDYDPDTLFTFNLQVTDKNGHDVWFSIWDKENNGYIINVPGTNYVTGATIDDIVTAEVLTASDRIKNIEYDPTTGKVTYTEDGVNKDYIIIGENPNGIPYTGFFYFNSGNTVTVLMKAGWNLRFTNLPNGSTYTFVENLSSAYSLEKVELNKYRKKDGAATPDINEDITLPKSTRVTGEIDEHNLSYTVTYTNKAVKTDNPVTARKIWEDNNNSYGKRPTSLKLNLLADGKLKETVIVNGPNWNYTWNNLAKYNAAGEEIVYTVTETAVNEGDLDSYIPVISSNGLTITNYYNLRDITVTKAWRANAKQATVVVRLTSDRGYDDSKPLNNPNWTYTWTDLPIYYLDINGNRQSVIYSVSEISVNDITLENGIAYDYDTYIHSTIGKWILVSIASNANGFTVTNDYKKYDYSLSFKKMSFTDYNDGKTNGLAGAKFRLYKYIGEGVSLDTDDPLTDSSNWRVIDELTSDANGMMVFNKIYKDGELYLDGLYEGEYRLVEIEAPKGHVLVSGQWRLFIDLNKNTDVVALRPFDDTTSVGRTTGLTFDDDNNIVVLNEEIPEIPATGGIGIPHYDKYGLLLMLLSVAIFLFNIVNQRKQIENI